MIACSKSMSASNGGSLALDETLFIELFSSKSCKSLVDSNVYSLAYLLRSVGIVGY